MRFPARHRRATAETTGVRPSAKLQFPAAERARKRLRNGGRKRPGIGFAQALAPPRLAGRLDKKACAAVRHQKSVAEEQRLSPFGDLQNTVGSEPRRFE